MPVIVLLAASFAQCAGAQSLLPGGTGPAVSVPVKVGSPPRRATADPGTMLRNVTILRGKMSVEVHIEASAPVKPAVMLLSQPERIVVDLAGVGCGGGHRLAVNAGGIESVRVALFREDPPVTRVVVDLAQRHEYRLLPAGSTVILAIDFDASLTGASPAATAQVAAATSAAPQTDLDTAAKGADAAAAVPPAPASSAEVSTASAPAQAPTSEAKLQPPPPRLPAEPAAEPTVSTTVPQVATLPAPTGQSETPSTAPGDEETTSHQAAKGGKPGVVRSLTVLREKDGIALRIEATKPLRATASAFSNPERIILDLADVRLPHPRRIAVNAADVRDVSAALFLVNPLVTRVVIDLSHPHAYHVEASGNSLTVRIETETVKAAGSQPAH